MVEGSLAVSVTDFAVLYVPPTGEAVTVGGVVSTVQVQGAGTNTLPALSVALIWKL
jgi:hypothetical protein